MHCYDSRWLSPMMTLGRLPALWGLLEDSQPHENSTAGDSQPCWVDGSLTDVLGWNCRPQLGQPHHFLCVDQPVPELVAHCGEGTGYCGSLWGGIRLLWLTVFRNQAIVAHCVEESGYCGSLWGGNRLLWLTVAMNQAIVAHCAEESGYCSSLCRGIRLLWLTVGTNQAIVAHCGEESSYCGSLWGRIRLLWLTVGRNQAIVAHCV